MTKSLRSPPNATTVVIIVCFFVAVAALLTLFKLYGGFSRAAAPDIFIDATEASGINFVHKWHEGRVLFCRSYRFGLR